MKEQCALDVLLSPGGPVRVTVRPCCLAALVNRHQPTPADPAGPRRGSAPAAADKKGAEDASLVCAADEVPAGSVSLVRAAGEVVAEDVSLVRAAGEVEMRVSP
ncbi:hypothetical protein ACQPZX_01680 [Actinoplanes sp. CA-142083]|uniref:hypothetical protein n=1 Tax=Actinoplanes sp. CA-142083 TaxID=3239903 RepID=UPI003D913891